MLVLRDVINDCNGGTQTLTLTNDHILLESWVPSGVATMNEWSAINAFLRTQTFDLWLSTFHHNKVIKRVSQDLRIFILFMGFKKTKTRQSVWWSENNILGNQDILIFMHPDYYRYWCSCIRFFIGQDRNAVDDHQAVKNGTAGHAGRKTTWLRRGQMRVCEAFWVNEHYVFPDWIKGQLEINRTLRGCNRRLLKNSCIRIYELFWDFFLVPLINLFTTQVGVQ